MDCHNCKHVGNVAGSAHRCCNHPVKEAAIPAILLRAAQGMMSETPLGTLFNKYTGEEISPVIKINPIGIEGGWALWPLNFDPCWIETCILFDKKE